MNQAAPRSVPFVPVRRVRTYEDVLAQIQRAIERGEYKPGDRLPAERDLAAAMGVNRAAVRQALHTLSILRIVDIRHGEGVFVRDYRVEGSIEALFFEHLFGGGVDAGVVAELMQLRNMIEIPVAGLAAEKRAATQAAELAAVVAAQADVVGDVGAFFDLDQRFHLLLATMAGNRMIPKIVNTLALLVKELFGEYVSILPDRTARSLEQHRRIAAAVVAGDAAAARKAMAEHLGDVDRQLGERA